MPKKITLAGKAMLFALFLLSLSISADAQKTVTGKVINPKDKQAIPNATVAVKGTNSGTQTNADGAFKITVPADNSILVITAIGFERIEVSTAGKTDVAAELIETSKSLNEIVVTGYTS
ncbi:MAG: carboxypeptidase-like regulatory domain-containing protein, partial [Bacteroidota bacterium]